jgi:hypothetical protein
MGLVVIPPVLRQIAQPFIRSEEEEEGVQQMVPGVPVVARVEAVSLEMVDMEEKAVI